MNAILTTKSGVTGAFSLNGDSAMQDQAYFTIQGTKGILQLGDANQFGGEARWLPDNPREAVWQTLEPVSTLSDNCRGLGVADMARCIREGGTPRVSAGLPCHVLDIIEKIMESGKRGQLCTTETVCDRPAPFDNWQELLK